MSEDKPQRPSANRTAQSLILLAILVVIAVIGYLIVDTIRAVTAPVSSVSGTFGTQAAQVLNRTPTVVADPVTIIKQVRSLSRLETSSFTIEKVITADSGEGPLGFLFRDKLLLVAHGEVIAGVDLGLMGDGAVKVAGTSVFVTMPASEVFVATLDNQKTYVYDRQTGVLGQQTNLETLARQKAEQEILNAALDDGILTLAQDNADQVVKKLLEALGFVDVNFVHGTPTPDQNRGGK
jgi:Protein of unknown function (DUF4230)